MPKPFKLSPFTVVVDQTQFTHGHHQCCGTQVPRHLEGVRAVTRLRLVIPEVVRGERLYQLSVAAQQAIEGAAKSFERLGKIPGCTTPEPPELQDAIQGIEKRFDDWVKEFGAKVATF